MTGITKGNRDVELLTTALDHVSSWGEFRNASGLQVLNFYLLALAVLTTGYVSALNGRLHLVATAIALIAGIVSGGTYLVGRRLRDDARFSELPMMEIQDRLASELGIDSLRMVSRSIEHRGVWWHNGTVIANTLFPLAVLGWAAAAIYPWFVH